MTTATITDTLPASLAALKENARRTRDESDRAAERERREAAEANWNALLDAVRIAIPADLMPFAEGIDAMPDGFSGELRAREITFRLPGHVPLAAAFERGSCLDWHRCRAVRFCGEKIVATVPSGMVHSSPLHVTKGLADANHSEGRGLPPGR
jgi:hypothetical protein